MGQLRMTSKHLLTAGLFIFSLLLNSYASAADVPRITVDELRNLLGSPDIVIIDVRTPKEWKKTDQKIKGAVWEDSDESERWAGKYPRDKTIILYCS